MAEELLLEELCLLGYKAAYPVKISRRFGTNMPPPLSGSKSKKPA
jgi:hypothetical protein